jgi:hypothetical protein
MRSLRFPAEYRLHNHYKSFVQFHVSNPHVLDLIVHEINRAKSAGIRKVSIKTIIGAIRWNLTVSTSSQDGFKINDAFTSLYAILIEHSYPEFSGMFEQREIRSI